MAAVGKKRPAIKRKVNKASALNSATARRHLPVQEAPDWGEPIGEAPEARVTVGQEAPDAGYGTFYSEDD